MLVVDGHPDASRSHFVHALAEAYVQGAKLGGHDVRAIRVAALEFPLLRSSDDFYRGEPPDAICEVQRHLAWCEHFVLLYPLWLGSMPALAKALLEQTLRPRFAFEQTQKERWPRRLLQGRSARVVITMGMPALIYRWFYRAHSLKSLERNVLKFSGFGPVRATVIGNVEGSVGLRRKWLRKMHALGRAAV